MHLSVLIETMRREGYELQVGKPQVIIKEIDGIKNEPFETLVIDVPEDPLTLPPKPKVDTTSKVPIEATTGYVINVPEEPLTLPPKPKLDTTTEVAFETTGYVIRIPEAEKILKRMQEHDEESKK